MRMSPRLKARRGRFGPGGLTGPILKILAPANNAHILGSPATLFIATASDDIQGDIRSDIVWTVVRAFGSPVVGSPAQADGSGGTVDLSAQFDAIGSPETSYQVRAFVADAGGNTASKTITVFVGNN